LSIGEIWNRRAKPESPNALSQPSPQRAASAARIDLLCVSSFRPRFGVGLCHGSGGFAPQRPVRSIKQRGATKFAFSAASCLSYLARGRAILGTFRFLLALSVALSHFGTVWGYHIMNGRMAVQCFYMISGFPISLVLSHKYDPSTADGRRLFYSNRALRIF